MRVLKRGREVYRTVGIDDVSERMRAVLAPTVVMADTVPSAFFVGFCIILRDVAVRSALKYVSAGLLHATYVLLAILRKLL